MCLARRAPQGRPGGQRGQRSNSCRGWAEGNAWGPVSPAVRSTGPGRGRGQGGITGVQVGDDPTQVAVEQVVRQTWVLEVL